MGWCRHHGHIQVYEGNSCRWDGLDIMNIYKSMKATIVDTMNIYKSMKATVVDTMNIYKSMKATVVDGMV